MAGVIQAEYWEEVEDLATPSSPSARFGFRILDFGFRIEEITMAIDISPYLYMLIVATFIFL